MLRDIDETCEVMEGELNQWKEAINVARCKCYPLNHFTMKQILNLRKDLANACKGQKAVDKLPLQTFLLLETVNKDISPVVLYGVLKEIIPDNAMFLTDNSQKNEQNFFTNGAAGKMHVLQPSKGKQVSLLNTFENAKETLEKGTLDIDIEDYLLAALHVCGPCATRGELVTWVLSHQNDDEETVLMLCEEAKKNRLLSAVVKEVYGQECPTVIDEEELLHSRHER